MTFAGAFSRRGPVDPALAARLRDAVGDGARTFAEGPLALAYTGPDPVCEDGAIAFVDGTVDEGDPLQAWRGGHLEKLRGDFACVLLDAAGAVLVRDHMGVRGLVVHDGGALVRFAGETDVLLRLLDRTPGPDPAALAHWLAFSGMPGAHTLHAGVERVEAAHVLDLGSGRQRRYWQPVYREPEPVAFEDAARELRARLETAVARRTIPGRTGVLLSGGLDSSSVAGLAAAGPHPPRRSYSAVFPRHPSVDERPHIELLAGALGLEADLEPVDGVTLLPNVREFVARLALPPVSPNMGFWVPLLQRARADGLEVLLDGEGGDEVYGMTPDLVADRLLAQGPRGAARVIHRMPGAARGLRRRETLRWVARYGIPPLLPRRPRPGVPVGYLRRDLARAFRETARPPRIAGPRWWRAQLQSATRTAPALVLDQVRMRARFAGGPEPRHPLIDVDVIEHVLALPPELALSPWHSRPLLRAAVDGLVPDPVRLRPSKSSFDALFFEAIAGRELGDVRALFAGTPEIAAYVDVARVRRELLDRPPPPPGPERQLWGVRLWRLTTAELWLSTR